MKSKIKVLLAGALTAFLVLALSGCGASETVLRVGASPSPHAEILKQIQPLLESEGVRLEITEFTDYVLPNKALENGEIDANFFQHQPYLDNFNLQNGAELVSVGKVHFEPLGIYPGRSQDLSAIPEGAKISVPNDSTNEARALLLLEQQGVIRLRADAGLSATVKDITENPHKAEFLELDAASLARTLDDVDFSVINGNVASLAGITDTLLTGEKSDSASAAEYANVIAVRKEDAEKPEIKKLVQALNSEDVRQFIENEYGKLCVPVF